MYTHVYVRINEYWFVCGRIMSSLFLSPSSIVGNGLASIHLWTIDGMGESFCCSGSMFALTKMSSWNAHVP